MEIDARFPTIQANRSLEARDGDVSAPPQAALVGGGLGSDFYISPVLRFDSRSLTVIFQVRDSRSGDVVRQFPPETVVERYRQDPTAKPFVLSPKSAAGDDSPVTSDVELLAPLATSGDDGRDSDLSPAAGDSDQTEGETVDLVA